MSENIHQIFIANPITSNASTDLMYFGQSPYGSTNDAAMTYANFAAQFQSQFVPSIQGTANEVLVNGTSGSPVTGTAITLTTPQAIGTSNTPQFSGAIFGSATGSVANASGTVQAVGLSGGLGSYYAESYFNGSGSAPTYFCYKSRSTTVGSFTAVQAGDVIGRWVLEADDGTQFSTVGAFILQAVGTISSGIIPGAWSFQTTNASGVLSTGMTIDSGQNVAFTHPLTPPSGGTGVSNPTAHTLPVAEGSSNFTFLGPLNNGQLLIGSAGADPVAATITAGTNISITNGAGSITVNASGLASFSWTDVTGTSQAMVANNGYIADNAGLVTLTLPTTAAQGTFISVCGNGAGGWSIAQNLNQSIKFGTQTTSTGTGGSLSSSNRYDQVDILCTVANTTWVVRQAVGNLTYV